MEEGDDEDDSEDEKEKEVKVALQDKGHTTAPSTASSWVHRANRIRGDCYRHRICFAFVDPISVGFSLVYHIPHALLFTPFKFASLLYIPLHVLRFSVYHSNIPLFVYPIVTSFSVPHSDHRHTQMSTAILTYE